ncbi:MAG: family 20 glycosylhydrolase [Fimbriimonadaceae bacterium]|nr:MAG: family 20 glycosylhydrolase [Fimbriimonadaceae bacterium]
MLKIWMVDFAREQSPTLDHLYHYATIAQRSGYDALGLYLEHRFAFAATPWSHGKGAITPSQIEHLQAEFPSLQIIPFINLLGHFEGFLYTEEGREYREENFSGLQACPSNPKFVSLCEQIIDETIAIFKSNIIHIGGDETAQLGKCTRCQERMKGQAEDEKAWLYREHFSPLLQRVIDSGRRPAIWGDMFLERPDALKNIPTNTLIFDWQYENGVKETAPKFAGYDVIACPTTAVYNAAWMHIERTENNVRQCAQDAHDLDLAGFCLTTWEQTLLNPYDSIFPAVEWASAVADNPAWETSLVDSFGEAKEWATALGIELEKMGGVWAASGHRHKLKCRLLLAGNPFLAWLHHRDEVQNGRDKELLLIIEKSIHYAPNEECKNVSLALRAMVEALMIMDEAHKHYAARQPDAAISKLAPMRYLFESLAKLGKQNHERIGGSLADIERCKIAKRHIEICIQRIRDYENGELGYLPAFEVLTNHRFTPHDQACWWLVNKWANE